jgi:hypothetical protein
MTTNTPAMAMRNEPTRLAAVWEWAVRGCGEQAPLLLFLNVRVAVRESFLAGDDEVIVRASAVLKSQQGRGNWPRRVMVS